MTVLVVFLYALTAVAALLLIGLILIQPSKSGGMGAAFGGVGESAFGGRAGSHLTKATVVLTAIFFVVTLALAALIGHGYKTESENSAVRQELMAAEETKVTSAAKESGDKPAVVKTDAVKTPETGKMAAPAVKK